MLTRLRMAWMPLLVVGCAAAARAPAPATEVHIAASQPDPDFAQLPSASRKHTPITPEALNRFFGERFASQVADGLLTLEVPEHTWAELQEELTQMGIDTMEEVAGLIPRDFVGRARLEFQSRPNTLALTRTLLMLHDVRRYFDRAWQEHWYATSPCDLITLREYGIGLTPVEPAVMDPEAIGGECVPSEQE